MYKKYFIVNFITILAAFNCLHAVSLNDYSDAINNNAIISNNQFISHAFTGNLQTIIDFLGNLGNVNVQEADGTTALHNAVHQMNKEMTELLLSIANINVNLRDKFGYTPLHWGVLNNDKIILGMLLSNANINLDIADLSGKTALHLAAERNLTEIADILLGLGAQTNLTDNSGSTALQLAMQKNTESSHQAMIDLLNGHTTPAAIRPTPVPATTPTAGLTATARRTVPAVVPARPTIPATPATRPVAQTETSDSEDQICPICFSNSNNRKIVPCGHEFCKTCIRNWARTSGQHAPCPICRTPMQGRIKLRYRS